MIIGRIYRKESKHLEILILAIVVSFATLSFYFPEAHATTYVLSDQASCQGAPFYGTWHQSSPPTCAISGFNINSGDTMMVGNSIFLLNEGTISNAGILINYGTIYDFPRGAINNYNSILNKGTLNNADLSTGQGGIVTNTGVITNSGTLTNTGTINNVNGSTETNAAGQVITTTNNGVILNSGTMWNYPGGTFTNRGNLTNAGIINNASPATGTGGTITNSGSITNNPGGAITSTGLVTNDNTGTISNNAGGTITNFGTIRNSNNILNYCKAIFNESGQLTGNPVWYGPCIEPSGNGISSREHQPASGIPPTTPPSIPSWIKNTANWWSNGQVSDAEFIKSLQYLVDNKVISVPQTEVTSAITGGSTTVPSWVKNTAGMWSTGKISDQEFLSSVQYLIGKGIIKTTETASSSSSSPANQFHPVSTSTMAMHDTTLSQPFTNTVNTHISPCISSYLSKNIPNDNLSLNFVKSWNSNGVGLEFKKPTGISLDLCGNVYVTDTGNHQVEKFDGNGQYIYSWGNSGSPVSLTNPTSIAVDSNGRIWVIDTTHVISFNQNGQLLSNWGSATTNCCTSLVNTKTPIIAPIDVALDWTKSNVIVSYSDGLTEISDDGGKWKSTLRFSTEYLAVDPNENAWLSGDYPQQCVSQIGCREVYNGIVGGKQGSYVSYSTGILAVSLNPPPCQPNFVDAGGICFGEDSTFPPRFTPPAGNYSYTGVAIDSAGRVFVADSIGDRILVFDNRGNYVTSWGSKGSGNDQFNDPTSIAIDKFDDVYVVDSGNNRIEKFAPNGS